MLSRIARTHVAFLHDPVTGFDAIRLHVMRCNPADRSSIPHMQAYELEQSEGMTLFVALSEIKERIDPTLQFDFVSARGSVAAARW